MSLFESFLSAMLSPAAAAVLWVFVVFLLVERIRDLRDRG